MWEIAHWDEPYKVRQRTRAIISPEQRVTVPNRCRLVRQGLDWRQVTFGVAQEGLRPKVAPGVPPALTKLLRMMWAAEPGDRPQLNVVCEVLEEEHELSRSPSNK